MSGNKFNLEIKLGKANSGNIILMLNANGGQSAFGKEYIGNVFIVDRRTNEREEEYYEPGVFIKVYDSDLNTYISWKMHDRQYVILNCYK